MKTLATTLRRTMLVACYLLGALVSAGGQGYAGSQGYLGSQDYSGWLSFTGGAGVTDGATSGAQAPSSTHVPSTVELTASRLRYRSPTADSRPRVIRPFEKPAQRWSAGHRSRSAPRLQPVMSSVPSQTRRAATASNPTGDTPPPACTGEYDREAPAGTAAARPPSTSTP